MTYKVISLFSGTGGSSLGYKLAGLKVLLSNEFVEAAWECYEANFPGTVCLHEDIRKLTGDIILSKVGLKKGELDVLDGSPPCASFSTAGKREKKWGTVTKYSDVEQRVDDLLFEYARILGEIQPGRSCESPGVGATSGKTRSRLCPRLGSPGHDLLVRCPHGV